MDYRVKHCKVVDVGHVPEDVRSVIFYVLDDPPDDGLSYRSEFSRARSGPPGRLFKSLGGGVALSLAPCPFPASRSLHDILYKNEQLPALSLHSGHYQHRAIVAWGVEAVTTTSCIIYGSVESTLGSIKKRTSLRMSSVDVMHFVKTHAIPAGKRRGYLRGCVVCCPLSRRGSRTIPSFSTGGSVILL